MPVRSMYIDVDLTLVDDDLKLYVGAREKLAQWYNKYTLICWSHGGAEHAERTCKKHKVAKYFKHFLDKPDILVDDNPELLIEFPAILLRSGPKWWQQNDHDIFSGSRAWKQALKGKKDE
jgi:hypothetical protein